MDNEIRYKPILFNEEMVRAILENRKTMTRRIIKIDLSMADSDINDKNYLFVPDEYGDFYNVKDLCQYKIGDILYVRETWAKNPVNYGYPYCYKASIEYNSAIIDKWKPSIHMPKKAARIFLKVTDIRVERLQDMDEEDYSKEGFQELPKGQFAKLWNSTINNKDIKNYGFEANPWVWVIEFEDITKEI